MDYESILSKRVQNMKPSGIRKFFDLAATMDGVISLGVGEPDFSTPWSIRKEAIDVLERRKIVYTANSGLAQLRESVAKYLTKKIHVDYNPEHEIIITVGGSEAIDIAIRGLINPEDEVLIVEPSFVCYSPIVEMASGVAVPIATKQENKFKLTAQELKEKITDKTK
ncbi:MAG: aminotransferase class I/II-fold pyridoxal phosphate-dependent enzyme, partial [Oscillospiraceae bacterium]|nr:aminotransferase class I/II-fold pyridoxal phosphate-dependent enzyme [Oscillospiraceae bacterium]